MQYYVYILSSRSRNLYTGVTNDIARRVWQHRQGRVSLFTRQYRIQRLVYFERHDDVRRAISREKEIKGWRRAKKIALIETPNPAWEDLAAKWFPAHEQEHAQKRRAGPSSLRSSG